MEFLSRLFPGLSILFYATICLGYASNGHAQEQAGEEVSSSGVTVHSPFRHTTVAPGEAVPISVMIESSLNAEDVIVSGTMRSNTATLHLNKTSSDVENKDHYEGILNIPLDMSGPHEFIGMVANKTGMVGGFVIRLDVVSVETPTKIEVSRHYSLRLKNRDFEGGRTILVRGIYANGIKRDISSSKTGTYYTSTNQSVVTVNNSGVLQAVAPGQAFIIVEHRGLRSFVVVRVPGAGREDYPVEDQTNKVVMTASQPRPIAGTGRFEVLVKIQNRDELPLVLPLHLVVTGLDKEIVIKDVNNTRVIQPVGAPTIFVETNERNYLSPGSSSNVKIQFYNPLRKEIVYNLQLYSGAGL